VPMWALQACPQLCVKPPPSQGHNGKRQKAPAHLALSLLDLRNNDLQSLPPALGAMTTLRSVQLEGNGLRTVRPALLRGGCWVRMRQREGGGERGYSGHMQDAATLARVCSGSVSGGQMPLQMRFLVTVFWRCHARHLFLLLVQRELNRLWSTGRAWAMGWQAAFT
jgi:hypothetical protein